MSNDKLLAKMQKARQVRLPINNDIVLIARRPTDLEAVEFNFESAKDAVQRMADFVINWEGVKEANLIPSGSDRVAAFSREVFELWIADNPEYWASLVDGLVDAYKAHVIEREQTLGN